MTLSSVPWQPGYPIDLRGEPIASRAATGPYGDVEFGAARILARSTGARVILQDDNSAARTPDLRIEYSDGRTGVGEVVTVTDGYRAAETRAFAKGDLDLFGKNLNWCWWVTAPANVDRRRLGRCIMPILEEMEMANERPPMLGGIDPETAGPGELKLLKCGVTEVAASDRPGDLRGHVRWQPQGIEADFDLDSDGFQRWLDGFLAGEGRKKIDKLTAVPGITERHLLVGVSWSAPGAVRRFLDDDVEALPSQAPVLPIGLSHLWIWPCESWTRRALSWWPDRGWFDVTRRGSLNEH